MLDNRRTWSIALIASSALYCALRFWRMTDSCLWFDEIFSVHAAEHDWGPMLLFIAQDLIHPPLFYTFLKIWISFGGESLFWLRLLPVVFACLALVPFYLLCGELKIGRRTLALAVFLLAVNGTFIKYAQLIRMYSLLILLSMFSIWLFARYFNRGKNLVLLSMVNLLMIYTHYYGWLVVGSEFAAVLLFQRFKWRGVTAMTGILGTLFLPWLWFVWKASQTGSEIGQNIGWIPRPGFAEIGTYIIDLSEPLYFQASSSEPASNYFVSIPLLLIFTASFALFVANFRNLQIDEKRNVQFLGLFSLLPIVIVFLASWVLPHSIWGTRHLIIVAGPLMLLIALIFARPNGSFARNIFLALIVLISGYAFVLHSTRTTPVYVWCAWNGIANAIVSNTTETEVAKVYTFENLVAYHVWFATRKTRRVEIAAVKGVEGMHEDVSYFLPRGFDEVKKRSAEDIEGDRAWLVFRTESPGQENPLLDMLSHKGYRICPGSTRRFGKTDVHRREIVRGNEECGNRESAADTPP